LALSATFAATLPARADEPPPAATSSYETVVRASGGPAQPVSEALDAEQARQLPGTGGDPSLAARDLPGVARPAPGSTGLVVWGATPAETRILYEGIDIPALYHLGGLRSTVGAELVGRIDLVPGAFGVEYGRAIGGLVRVEGRSVSEGTHLVVDANLLDTSAAVRAALSPGVHVGASLRVSDLDETYGRLAPQDATALYPIPRYADAQADLSVDVGSGAVLRAFVLGSDDRVSRNLGSSAVGLPERVETQGQRWWRAALAYSERGQDDRVGATLWVGGAWQTLDQSFGLAPTSQTASERDVGVLARYKATLAPRLRLTLGLDAALARTHVARAGSLTSPPREGDISVFGQPPGDDVNADTWTATTGDVGPYVLASITAGQWTFAPGLRADAFPVDGDRLLPPVGGTPRVGYSRVAWALDPRASVSFGPRPGLVFAAAAGIYHQPADPRDLSAVFGSPGLAPARAFHAALSAWKGLTEGTNVEAIAFYRYADDLPARSPLSTPLLAQALTSDGRGRSFGVSVVGRRDLAIGVHGWITYTLSRSERWISGGPSRLLDYDQTHVLTAIASREWRAWTFGARLRYATGMPRTPVTGSFFDARDGVAEPLFGPQNSTRLPSFLQLDARVDRTFVAGRARITLYLDVQNLTGRRNPEEIVYSRDFTSSGYLTGPPLLALIGVRIES
jgi:hypothetical protein